MKINALFNGEPFGEFERSVSRIFKANGGTSIAYGSRFNTNTAPERTLQYDVPDENAGNVRNLLEQAGCRVRMK